MAAEIPTFGRKIDLVIYRRDIFSGKQIRDGKISKECLPVVIKKSVPQKNLQVLEKRFKTKPDKVIHKNFHVIYVSEWNTVHKDVVLGTESVNGQFGEIKRSWYLRSTKIC